jgi:hypothetical protein
MRFKSFLFVLGIVALALPDIGQAAPVRRVVPKGKTAWTSKPYGFAVWMPTKPTTTRDNSGSTDQVIFQSNMPTVTYGVIVTIARPGTRFGLSKATLFFDEAQKTFLQNSSGTLVAQQDLRLGKVAGRAIRTSHLQGQSVIFTRSYYTSQFIYQITASVQTRNIRSQATQINRVLDSFRILPQ